VVEFLAERIEALLLTEQVALGRARRFTLERAVHALVGPVFFGVSRCTGRLFRRRSFRKRKLSAHVLPIAERGTRTSANFPLRSKMAKW
jgi:hypothetical protein